MKSLFSKNNFPVATGVLLLIVVVLFGLNFQSGKFLLGWDNLVPELNFGLNLQRNFNGVWLSYRGLGLVDGLSFIANIIHTLFAGGLSLILPIWMVRYVIIFGLYGVGGFGTYYLIKEILRLKDDGASLVGAIFYLLNLATIQTFFTPYEVFIYHFAALPWLIWSTLRVYKSPTIKTYLEFGLFSILATPTGHVPTVFLVWLMLLLMINGIMFKVNGFKTWLKTTLKLWGVVLLINAFWLMPYAYAFAQTASVIANATINKITTDEVVLNNHVFGTFAGTALLKSFNLIFLDQNNGTIGYLMESWRSHVLSNSVTLIGWTWLIFVALGMGNLILKPSRTKGAIALLFGLSFFMLGNEIWLFKPIHGWLNDKIPFLYQAYRFVFTKFGVLYSLTYSVLLAMGWHLMTERLKIKSIVRATILLGYVLLLCYQAKPAFQGNFFYKNLRVNIPSEYFNLASYFKSQPKADRILVLPMPTFWGWTNNTWGYRGSGWIWQMIEQPMTDRAFDPWSVENETMYKQFNYVVESEDKIEFNNLLDKYNIKYILVDKSIYFPGQKSDERYMQMLTDYNLDFEQGFLKVYRLNSSFSDKEKITVEKSPGKESNFDYMIQDQLYRSGEYITYDDPRLNIQFPFANLDSRSGINIDQQISAITTNSQPNASILISAPLSLKGDWNLGFDREKLQVNNPLMIWMQKNQDNIILKMTVSSPGLMIDDKLIKAQKDLEVESSIALDSNDVDYLFFEKQIFDVRWIGQGETAFVGFLPQSNAQELNLILGKAAALNNTPERIDYFEVGKMKVVLPKVEIENIPTTQRDINKVTVIMSSMVQNDVRWLGNKIAKNCDVLNRGKVEKRLKKENEVEYNAVNDGISCDYVDYRKMQGFGGYLVVNRGKRTAGRGLKEYIVSVANDKLVYENLIPFAGLVTENQESEFAQSYLIKPAVDKGMVLNVETRAFDWQKSTNSLEWISLTPINLDWIQSVGLMPVLPSDPTLDNTITVNSQSFSNGWVAWDYKNWNWKKPINSVRVLQHVKVNGWENGFVLDAINQTTDSRIKNPESSVLIFFWPQVLEWLGFLILIIGIGGVGFGWYKSRYRSSAL